MTSAIPLGFLLIEIQVLGIIKVFDSVLYLPLIALVVPLSFAKVYRENLRNGLVEF